MTLKIKTRKAQTEQAEILKPIGRKPEKKAPKIALRSRQKEKKKAPFAFGGKKKKPPDLLRKSNSQTQKQTKEAQN